MKISVCMLTYNGEKYLIEQLDSILIQLMPNDELLIMDDHSTDRTPEILNSYAKSDQRIKIWYNNEQSGVVKNIDSLLKKSQGDVIFISDQDDVWLPDKCQKMLTYLELHPTCQVLMGDLIVTDKHLKVTEPSFLQVIHGKNGVIKNIKKNSYVGCNLAIKRQFFSKILPIPKQVPMHDSWIGILGEYYHVADLMFEPTMYYRRHEETVTFLKSNNPLWKKMFWRIQLSYLLIKRIVFNK